ncbi:MAG: YHYH protein [Chloroflexota bacterium]
MKRCLTVTVLTVLLTACGGPTSESIQAPPVTTEPANIQPTDIPEPTGVAEATEESADKTEEMPEATGEDTVISVDPSLFILNGLVGDIAEEPCTLSGGTETTCYRFSVSSIPVEHGAGPWCPGNITDSAEAGGIWPENGVANDVSGAFVENLDSFYNDDTWQLYNDDGAINVTDSAEACAAAAQPNVVEEYQNYCVQCLLSYVEEEVLLTYVIPVTPVAQETPSPITNSVVGVAFNGVNFDPPAPTEAILGAYTIAPFDDCGGHINLNTGYHYHAHTGCITEIAQPDGHAPMIGYAMDGFPLYALLDENGEEPVDLDESRGHYDEIRGYHYHVASDGSNSFINSFHGEYGCTFAGDGEGQTCDASSQGGRGNSGPSGNREGGQAPDFAAAAEALGISEQELMDALGAPPFDIEAAAETLGIPVEELQGAIDITPPGDE